MPATIDITTDDGVCPAHVFHPPGPGPWPAVLFFMDGLGIRPALFEMAERLAGRGYYVLLPDLYYRSGPYEPMDPRRIFSEPELRQTLFQKFMGKLGQANAMRDTRAVLAFLASQPAVAPGKIGATGYCMGGPASRSPPPATSPSGSPRSPPTTRATSPPTPPTAHTSRRPGSRPRSTSGAPATTPASPT